MTEYHEVAFLSQHEAAEKLGVSLDRIKHWTNEGILPSSRLGNEEDPLYLEENVELFIQNQKTPRCGFCGKGKYDKKTLVASDRGTFMCSDCLKGCLEILRSEEEAPESIPRRTIRRSRLKSSSSD